MLVHKDKCRRIEVVWPQRKDPGPGFNRFIIIRFHCCPVTALPCDVREFHIFQYLSFPDVKWG